MDTECGTREAEMWKDGGGTKAHPTVAEWQQGLSLAHQTVSAMRAQGAMHCAPGPDTYMSVSPN